MQGVTNSKVIGTTINNQDLSITLNGSYSAEEGYTGLGTVTVAVPDSGITLEVTNKSSVNRAQNEKVWIKKVLNSWEIIDWASADVNSITAKCLESISINETGTVALTNDGVVTNHMVRDFSLGTGLSESNIDDSSHLLTVNSKTANSYIYNTALDIPTSYGNHVEFKVKAKFIDNSGTGLFSNVLSFLGRMSKDIASTFPTNYSPNIRITQTTVAPITQYISGSYARYDGGVDSGLNILCPTAGIVDFNQWVTIGIKGTSNGGVLEVTDYSGTTHTYSNGNAASFVNNRKSVFIGFSTIASADYDIVFDLDNCGVFDTDNNTALWTPYKMSIV